MRGRGALFVWTSEADYCTAYNNGWFAPVGFGRFDSCSDRITVVPVNFLNIPAVGLETGSYILRKGEIGGTVDGDAVGIVQVDQLVEFEVPGKGGRLMGDALHQVAVAYNGVGVMVCNLVYAAVETCRQMGFGQGHSDSVCKTLPQRSGCGLHAWGEADFRVARGKAVPLAEIPELLITQRVPRKMQQAVEQHRTMPGRQDKAVAVGPVRIIRIVPEKFGPQYIGHVSHAHRHAGMPRIGGLNRIHTECAYCVYTALFKVRHRTIF